MKLPRLRSFRGRGAMPFGLRKDGTPVGLDHVTVVPPLDPSPPERYTPPTTIIRPYYGGGCTTADRRISIHTASVEHLLEEGLE